MTRLSAFICNFFTDAADAIILIFCIMVVLFFCGYAFETGAGLARIHMGGMP